MHLTQCRSREYRIIRNGVPQPWRKNPAGAVGRQKRHLWTRAENWPREWTVFALDRLQIEAPGVDDPVWPEPASEGIPETVGVAGETCVRRTCTLPDKGVIDLTPLFGGPYQGRTARAYAWLEAGEPADLHVLSSADWSHRWWVNGTPAFEVKGNGGDILRRAHLWPLSLPRGRHLLCLEIRSGSGGWGFANEAYHAPAVPLRLPEGTTLQSREAFTAAPPETVSVTYSFPEGDPGRIPSPVPQRESQTVTARVDGLPPEDFRQGGFIYREWNEQESQRLALSTAIPDTRFRESNEFKQEPGPDRLTALRASDNTLRFGPVWIPQSAHRFICSFRTRIPASVTLTLPHGTRRSDKGLTHHIEVNIPPGECPLPYRISDESGELVSGSFHPPSTKAPCLLIAGDPAPGTEAWRQTAAILLDRNPDALLLLGDLVSSGKNEALWQQTFYEPANALLSRTPLACVFGNHDGQSGLLREYFPHAVTDDLWTLELGNSRWIGLYSGAPVPEEATSEQLREILRTHNPAIPVCFCSHYPPYSRSNHGTVDAQNRPTEASCRYARDVLLPILSQGNVRVWFTGHNHVYEHSLLPGDLHLVTTGGAGGYLYRDGGNPKQNPYSRVFRTGYHFCKVQILENSLEVRVQDRGHNLFDSFSISGTL